MRERERERERERLNVHVLTNIDTGMCQICQIKEWQLPLQLDHRNLKDK